MECKYYIHQAYSLHSLSLFLLLRAVTSNRSSSSSSTVAKPNIHVIHKTLNILVFCTLVNIENQHHLSGFIT